MAARIGYELHYEDGAQATEHGNRARLLAANAAAEKFFQRSSPTPEAQLGRDFLGERGFDPLRPRISASDSPPAFERSERRLAQGYTEAELVTAGLLSTGDRGNAYDRFRGRLIWPIRDITGQTVGFGARKLLDDQDKGPKYLNTPETPVYHKSQVLYGLDLARRDIAKGKQVVVVEGYTDVMACHLAGVTTAVATCGTAFGVDHIKVIRRVLGDVENANTHGTGEVIFTFDPDEAGQKAASRAFAEEQRFAAQTFVAVAREGLDPCDLRLHRGDEAVRRLIATRKPMFEFKIRRELAGYDLETVEGRVAALRAAAPVVAGIRDRALGIGYVRNLAGWLGMDPGEVQAAVEAARRRERPHGVSTGSTTGVSTGSTTGVSTGSTSSTTGVSTGSTTGVSTGSITAVSAGSTTAGSTTGVSAGSTTAGSTDEGDPSLTRLATDPTTRTERDVLMALLQHPEHIGPALTALAASVPFVERSLAVVRDAIAAAPGEPGGADWVDRVTAEVPPRFATLVGQLAVAPIPEREDKLPVYCRRLICDFVDRDLLRRKVELLGTSQRLDPAAEPERYANVQRELVRIETERRSLREE